MRYLKLSVFVVAFTLFSLVALHAEEVGQEAASPAAAPAEVKQAAPQAAAPAETATAAPSGAQHESHDPAFKEKRFVAAVGPDGVQHVEITGGEYYYDPNYIVVKANVPVEFTLKKEPGYVPHDMVVKAPDAGIDFKVKFKKEPVVVKFTPTKAGTYEMECDERFLWFKSHKDRGMYGYIEVVP